MSKAPIISVTGTKGKTTTVAVIADVLLALQKDVLKVDTTGHFVNGTRKSTLEDSRETWQLVPSVCPGRYLWEFSGEHTYTDPVAVLECSLGCSGLSGLGYRNHDVGVFLNVFEDHLGSSSRLKSKKDIAVAKSFIFERIKKGGYAVFNADDELVVGQLSVFNHEEGNLLPVGIDFAYFDIKKHLLSGGAAVTIQGSDIVILQQNKATKVADTQALPWTFNGKYLPSVYNLMHVVGALYGYFEGALPEQLKTVLEAVRLDPLGGRLTVLRAANGATVIADYAHEKVSLATLAVLAKTFVKPGGKLTGVVRLAYDRTPTIVQETGKVVAENYDNLVVYDKIDGHFRKPKKIQSTVFKQEVGYTSSEFTKAIAAYNPLVTRILREDEAILHAAKYAQPEDVVIVIVNDDIERSIGFIKSSFKAEFV